MQIQVQQQHELAIRPRVDAFPVQQDDEWGTRSCSKQKEEEEAKSTPPPRINEFFFLQHPFSSYTYAHPHVERKGISFFSRPLFLFEYDGQTGKVRNGRGRSKVKEARWLLSRPGRSWTRGKTRYGIHLHFPLLGGGANLHRSLAQLHGRAGDSQDAGGGKRGEKEHGKNAILS